MKQHGKINSQKKKRKKKNNERMKKEVPRKCQKKVALKAKIIRKDNKGFFILIKEIIHLCHINIINPYAPNNVTSKYMKQTLLQLKGEMNTASLIIDLFTPSRSQQIRGGKKDGHNS